MSELTEFLLARIAEDEATATRAAEHRTYAPTASSFDLKHGITAGLQWQATYDHVYSDWTDGERGKILHVGNFGTDLTRHIARHDPARVLAECEAKRAIVEAHSPPRGYQAPPFGPEDTDPPFYEPEDWQKNQCGECGWTEEWQATEYGPTYPCRTLRLLALPHAGHPDYREAWRP